MVLDQFPILPLSPSNEHLGKIFVGALCNFDFVKSFDGCNKGQPAPNLTKLKLCRTSEHV